MKTFSSKLLLAGKTIKIKTNSQKINSIIRLYCREFYSNRKTDLALEYFFYEGNRNLNLYVMKDKWRSEEKIKEKKGEFFFRHAKGKKGKKLISGILDLNKKKGKFKVRTDSGFFLSFFVFNLAKCLSIYLNELNGCIIHSSALADKKNGFLFSGKNDAGKTTILKLCSGTEALGEDLNFIIRKNREFFVQIFPFISLMSGLNKKKADPFMLKAILFLKKSGKLEIKKITKKQAMIRMLENDINGTFNFQHIKLKERISLYEKLFDGVPAFILSFPLKANLWKKIKLKLKKLVKL